MPPSPEVFFNTPKYYEILDSKIRQEKLLKFMKILNYTKSSCIIFCAIMSWYSQHMLFTKIIQKFWSRDIDVIRDISTFWTVTRLYLLNSFKYFLIYFRTKYVKVRQEKFERIKSLRFWDKSRKLLKWLDIYKGFWTI